MKHAAVLAMGAAVGALCLDTGWASRLPPAGPMRPGGVALAGAPAPVRVVAGRWGLPAYRVAPPVTRSDSSKAAVFTIRYLNAGDVNYFGDVCVGWPDASKAAFSSLSASA